MSNKYKGFFVTLENEIDEERAEETIDCIRAIRNVQTVEPCISNSNDYMMYEKGYSDAKMEMLLLLQQLKTH